MPVFVWKGRTLAGESQAGEIEVARAEEALEALRKKRILVTSVRPKGSGFMLIFIIQTFAKMFTDFGGELPMPTRIVLALSGFLKSFWWAMLLVLVGAGVALQRYYSTENGRRVMDNAMLKIPVLGDVLLKGSVARFTRTLGTLIASGVPILSGHEMTARTAGIMV